MSTHPGYGRFINSPEWKAIRQRAFAKHGRKCQRCPATTRLHVHHLTYLRFGGDERMEDLAILCEACHREAHGMRPLSVVPKKAVSRKEKRRRQKLHAANLAEAIRAGTAPPADPAYEQVLAMEAYRKASRENNWQRSQVKRQYFNRKFG